LTLHRNSNKLSACFSSVLKGYNRNRNFRFEAPKKGKTQDATANSSEQCDCNLYVLDLKYRSNYFNIFTIKICKAHLRMFRNISITSDIFTIKIISGIETFYLLRRALLRICVEFWDIQRHNLSKLFSFLRSKCNVNI